MGTVKLDVFGDTIVSSRCLACESWESTSMILSSNGLVCLRTGGDAMTGNSFCSMTGAKGTGKSSSSASSSSGSGVGVLLFLEDKGGPPATAFLDLLSGPLEPRRSSA